MDCVFCRIAAGELPAEVVFRSDEVLAFKDIHPSAPTHILVISRKHVPSLDTAEDGDILGKVQLALGRVANELGVTGGYKVVVNGGKFQDVKHLHYHLLAGFDDPDKKFGKGDEI